MIVNEVLLREWTAELGLLSVEAGMTLEAVKV